jgi:hypothetical protein
VQQVANQGALSAMDLAQHYNAPHGTTPRNKRGTNEEFQRS